MPITVKCELHTFSPGVSKFSRCSCSLRSYSFNASRNYLSLVWRSYCSNKKFINCLVGELELRRADFRCMAIAAVELLLRIRPKLRSKDELALLLKRLSEPCPVSVFDRLVFSNCCEVAESNILGSFLCKEF